MSFKKVSELSELTTAADEDLLLISDLSEGASKKITVANAINSKVDAAVADLVDSAPEALDTLNELAAALGDDANFATTVTTSIGTKWTQDNTKISNWDTAYGWGDHSTAGYLTSITGESIADLSDVYSSMTPTDGQVLTYDTTNGWQAEDPTASVIDYDNALSALVAETVQDAIDELAGSLDLVNDTTPQLGGTLDANGNDIDMGTNTITDTKVGQWDTAYGWGDHAAQGYLTGISGQSIEDLSDVATMTPSDGQLLTWDSSTSKWNAEDAPVSLPDQTGQSGNYLTTNGTTASWDALATVANTGAYSDLSGTPTNISTFTNDSGYITGNQTITLSGDATGSGTTSITVTVANDSHSHTSSTVSGLLVSNFNASAIQTGSESFVDSDTVLMTAAAVQDKILSYGYTTATGDITGVTAGSGLTGGGSSGSVTLNVGAGTGISVAADTVSLSHLGIQNLTDPNADRVLFWDDSAGATAWLTLGDNLTITGTTLDASGGGATGGGSDAIFYENDQAVTTNYTITTNKNAMSAGPITINSGVTVTVPSGSTWTVV